MPTIDQAIVDGLNDGTITLDRGSHDSYDEGHCAMEVVARAAGEGHTDAPECASTVIRDFVTGLNDAWDDEQQQKLIPFLPRMIGTTNDGHDLTRAYMALDWLIRTYTPTWLELGGLTEIAATIRALAPITDMATAEAAGPVIREAQKKADAAWCVARSAYRDAAKDARRDATGDVYKTAKPVLGDIWSINMFSSNDAAICSGSAAAYPARGTGDVGSPIIKNAWNAVRSIVQVVAWNAAEGTVRITGPAADLATKDISRAALQSTVDALQASVLDLLDRILNIGGTTS